MSDGDTRVSTDANLVQRLERAINDHDLDAVVACFSADYHNETPVHPARSFRGRDQVRHNWQQILGSLPDLRAVLLRWTVDNGTIWAEWDWSGTRADGAPLTMRGVTVLGVDRDTAEWARFYMEPVSDDGIGVAAAVRDQVGAT